MESAFMQFFPVHHVEGDFSRGLLLIADHARRDLPPEYGSLGLAAAEFDRHIAYDIGVETMTRSLAHRLGVPAVLGGFSRLLIDPNRGEDDPTLIMRLSDGAVIPGNHPLSEAEREKRLDRFYRPYDKAVAIAIEKIMAATGKPPLVISIHSFTPFWKTRKRPWHVALLWDSDPRAVVPLVQALRSDPALVVGDNEPYDGALRNDTMFRHCVAAGYAHALIEVRQDLIAAPSGAEAWAERLAPMLAAVNARPDMHEVQHFGSRTGPVPAA
nr:N-formylglutamate amidohydrolase [Phyllobacterium salinisoli]